MIFMFSEVRVILPGRHLFVDTHMRKSYLIEINVIWNKLYNKIVVFRG